MDMRLIITDKERAEIARIKELASQNRMTLQEMKDIMEGKVNFDPSIRNKEYTMYIPEIFFVTYTEEEQTNNVLCRHLSMSCVNGEPPEKCVLTFMMREFGFVNDVEKVVLWLEKVEDGRAAINVVEPLDGNIQRLMKDN
jgi:hypothetical protein